MTNIEIRTARFVRTHSRDMYNIPAYGVRYELQYYRRQAEEALEVLGTLVDSIENHRELLSGETLDKLFHFEMSVAADIKKYERRLEYFRKDADREYLSEY